MKNWIVVIAAVLVGGCSVGPNYQRPETEAPQGWQYADSSTGLTTSRPIGYSRHLFPIPGVINDDRQQTAECRHHHLHRHVRAFSQAQLDKPRAGVRDAMCQRRVTARA